MTHGGQCKSQLGPRTATASPAAGSRRRTAITPSLYASHPCIPGRWRARASPGAHSGCIGQRRRERRAPCGAHLSGACVGGRGDTGLGAYPTRSGRLRSRASRTAPGSPLRPVQDADGVGLAYAIRPLPDRDRIVPSRLHCIRDGRHPLMHLPVS